MPDIVIYVPILNQAAWCEAFQLIPGVTYVASDNTSTDGSGDILAQKGVRVVRQPHTLSRTDNWAFCLRHFVEKGGAWMKWLFAGDELYPEPFLRMRAAIRDYPEARLIITGFEQVDAQGKRVPFRFFNEPRLVFPEESLRLVAEKGNWFASPVNQCFQREGLMGNFDFGPFQWAADMALCLWVARRYPVLYWPEAIGLFNAPQRRYYRMLKNSFQATCEEGLLRLTACQEYEKLTGDSQGSLRLARSAETDMERLMALRGIERLGSDRAMSHLLEKFSGKTLIGKALNKWAQCLGAR